MAACLAAWPNDFKFMDLLASTSIIAAFIAGLAALLAPCCITVLLPSYLGSVFKEKYKILLMTFIFFLGILTVFLPIGLGASALAALFSEYHNQIFIAGGLIMILMGIFLIIGKSMSLPFRVNPTLKKYNIGSIYILGIFSAIATTCCAPVLAGVLALSATSGSLFWGAVYSVAYVLGMVAPLFFIALFLDKFNFTQKLTYLRKLREVKILGKTFKFKLTELIVGLIFLFMGSYIIYLSRTNQLVMQSGYQLDINISVASLVSRVYQYTSLVPNALWAVLLIAVVVLVSKKAINQFKKYE